MENSTFWAFLAITFIVGITLGIAIYGLPAAITGRAVISPFFPGINCNDTDGGINLALKGTCVDPWGSHTDVCASTADLVEYWCTNISCVSKVYNCPQYGYAYCYDGACVKGNGSNGTASVGITITPTTPTSPTETIRATLPVTYQGVLDMLNKCRLTYTRNDPNISCNQNCQEQGKTCIRAYIFDEISKVTLPYECSWMRGPGTDKALICDCCSSSGKDTLTPEQEAFEIAKIKEFRQTGGSGGSILQIQCHGDCCMTPRVMCCWYGGCESGCCFRFN